MAIAAGIPAGVYRTAQPDIDAVRGYEAFLGRRADWVIAYMADAPSWAQFEGAILQASTNGPAGTASATSWAPLLSGRGLLLGVPACVQGSSWADEAAGRNDAHWAALARTLVHAGLGGAALRVGRELNGSWYAWKVTPANAAAYRAGYARIVSAMRDAGMTGAFMWNPYIGQGTFGPSHGAEDAYPGDAVVDVIGIDGYDGDWTGLYPKDPLACPVTAQQQVWDRALTGWDSFRGWYGLANAHGKPLAFPEWGLRLWKDAGVYHGGGDNAVLVDGMAKLAAGCGAWMHAMWEDKNMGVSDPDATPGRIAVPMARAAFLDGFGGPRVVTAAAAMAGPPVASA